MEEHPFHLAVIMDGNGRWARARGRRREWGHRAGAKAVRTLVEAAAEREVGILTLYAFSSDNWNRPEREVATLLALFRRYLRSETPRMVKEGIRLRVVGRRDRLPRDLVAAMAAAEEATAGGRRLTLRLAVDYSSRDMLLAAARSLARATGAATAEGDATPIDRAGLAAALGRAMHDESPAPDVDLLIRTGGERRLSDFLLWECAYAELVFTDRMWPDFDAEALDDALRDYGRRDRRFGRVAAAG